MQFATRRLADHLLAGEVGAEAIARLAARIDPQQEPQADIKYEVDCTQVTGFTPEGLVTLCDLIKSVRTRGGDVVLCGLRPEARSGVIERLAQAWLPPQLADELLRFVKHSQALAAQGPWKYISHN